jgi:hypothetical protein
MRFVTAVIHRVAILETASDFFCTALGFYLKTKQPDWQLLENGSVTVRLTTEPHIPFTSLHLELYCQQLEQQTADVLKFADTQVVAEPFYSSPFRLETRIQAPHEVLITLVKEFNEDEVGIVPELPVCLDWQASAVTCIQQLLRITPLAFRQLARQRITEQAEVLAAERGEISVDLNCAVQALAQVTPAFQHPTLVAALRECGIDSGDYFQIAGL